jgi:general secretion pathway protein D
MRRNECLLTCVESRELLGAAALLHTRRSELNRSWMILVAALAAAAPLAARADELPAADPFSQEATDDAASGVPSVGSNPFRSAGTPSVTPASSATVEPKSRRAASDQSLLDARRALSVGDLARAQQFLGRAQELGVAYDGPGDSPQRVAESIAQGLELAELRKSTRGGEAWRQSYSKFLVTQADALVSWNDLDTATRAAKEAGQLNPHFAANGVTPTSVLRRISELRNGAASLTIAGGTPAPQSMADAKGQTLALLAQSRAALAAGDLASAEKLAGRASALNVPDDQFAPTEDRPGRLAIDLIRARAESGSTELADLDLPTTSTPEAPDYVQAAAGLELGVPLQMAELPAAMPLPQPGQNLLASTADPAALLEAGEAALRAGDRAAALEAFRAAYANNESLDVLAQQRLQGHLQMLSSSVEADSESVPAPEGEMLDATAAGQSVVARQLSAEIGKRQSEAAKLRERDPNGAVRLLSEARTMVEESTLEEALKRQLLSRINASLAETNQFIKDHKSELELEAANQEILDEIERERVVKIEVQGRIAEMVDQFNKLLDEQRYAEAEVVANRLYEMAPDELVAQQVKNQANMIRREQWNREIIAQSETGVANTFLDIRDVAADALDKQTRDITYGEYWPERVAGRGPIDFGSRRSVKELEIEQKLKTQVLPKYEETPLNVVIQQLSELTGVNIHLDPRGLEQEAVRSDTPITFNTLNEISLKSALTLILEPLHLTYTIQDEVLKITSEDIRDGERIIRTYQVGDLVIPIPNFVPSNNMGLQGLINDAYAAMGGAGLGTPGPMALVADDGRRPATGPGARTPNNISAQFGVNNNPAIPGGGASPMSSGPGGLGGAASADFDSLIDLIVATVEHDSWMENGTGEGDIQPFPNNLSLVISQTQRVHEQIADLLEQLRRLQDLQVTIEVRFIRLTDNFFERIGVDFDFNIEDGTGLAAVNTGSVLPPTLVPGSPFEPRRSSATVGLNPTTDDATFPNYTVDLDLPFRQGSFQLSTPQFGQFDAQSAGRFGFAILSDIEAYFLIEAAQGDRRANVLQAPKVTLFNGQQATVVDSSFVPFVISVIPVVGDFAAAYQPVIVVLSEGTMMTVQAVVSDDRRYVRLTLVPFFSQIGEVRTFTFEGATETSTSTSITDDDEDGDNEQEDGEETIIRSGTTVQLPTFQVISVATTVSVPDGGTVLLGGIKRLREGRNEFGVPLLSKVPYVDRLFRNVAIGRETDSLMMMVTPHIIIQEEEEERLGTSLE